MKYLAIVPARAGSKGLLNKNFLNLDGKPLINYTLEAAKKSLKIDRLVVSTNDPKIINICKKKKIEYILRPKLISLDGSPTILAIHHVLKKLKVKENYSPDAVITLQPTSPFRTNKHIDEAINFFNLNKDADSLVSCEEIPHKYNPLGAYVIKKNLYLSSLKKDNVPIRRQNKKIFYCRNGAAIYITRISNIKKFMLGGKILGYKMDRVSSIDIDNNYDFKISELILKNKILLKSYK
jgi:CMP-N-acetylneuraminic acid synthetase